MEAKNVSAARGAEWFSCGWSLFKQDSGTWFIIFLIFVGIAIVLSFIPFIGTLTLSVITPALIAGFMFSASQMDQGNEIEIAYLFKGFKDKSRMNNLLTLGGLYLVAQILLAIILFALVGSNRPLSLLNSSHQQRCNLLAAST